MKNVKFEMLWPKLGLRAILYLIIGFIMFISGYSAHGFLSFIGGTIFIIGIIMALVSIASFVSFLMH